MNARAGGEARFSDIKDGTSNTIALSERLIYQGSQTNAKGGIVVLSGLNTNPSQCLAVIGPGDTLLGPFGPSHYDILGRSWGGGFMTATGFNTVLGPNQATCMNSHGEWNWGVFPPSSYHRAASTLQWPMARFASSARRLTRASDCG